MKTENSIAMLAKVSLFKGLKERQLKLLADHLVEQKYPAGSKIIEQGRVGFGLFIIGSGQAEVQFESEEGSTSVVNTLGAYDFFGEIALLDDGPRSASVVATEETTCLILNRIEFISIMMGDAEMGVLIATELAKRIRTLLESVGKN